MNPFTHLARAVRALVFRSSAERELDAELAFHIEKETEKLIATGVPPVEARRRARIAFGSVEATKEAYRDGRGARWIEDTAADVRFALRMLRRSPALAGAAIITLALGIGANTAIFSAVHAVIIRPLPFVEPDRLVMLWESNPDRGWVQQTAAPANVFDWAEQVRSFADVGGYASFTTNATLTGHGEPRQLSSAQVTGNFFAVLGVRPAAGALFRREETWATGELNAIISHQLWRSAFGGDTAIVGHTIALNGRDVRVVGILPATFELPGIAADVWRPTGFQPEQRAQAGFRRAHWIRPIARLRNGVTHAQADAELQTVIARLQQDYPSTNTNMGGGFTPLHEFVTGDTRRPLLILLGAVALLLLIACANVGNLLLVQAARRDRETSVRLALGAARSRLVRQALTESLVLSVLGGAVGFVLGWWSTRLLGALQPAGLLPAAQIPMSWSVFGYVAALTTASGLLFGLAPAFWNRRRAPAEVLREGTRGASSGTRARRWGEALLVVEVAIAVLLTTGAGLLVRSLWRLQRVDAGIESRGVLTTTITLPGIRYDSVAKVLTFWDQLRDRVRAMPGVVHVGTVSLLPLTVPSWSSDFTVEGWRADHFGTEVLHRDFSPGYTDVMRIPIRAGRVFDDTDRFGTEQVVVINDVIAKRFFPDEDPVGKRLTFSRTADSGAIWRTIVGVIGSERQSGLATPPRGEIFQPAAQRVLGSATLVVRTTGDPASMVAALRGAVGSIDPLLALGNVRTMDEVRAESAARQRFLAVLLVVFATVGLALAVVGVYGVMAQLARGRTREMGIRLALGAQSGALRWLVVRRGVGLTALGIGGGCFAALAASGAMEALLYDVQPVDPLTFVAVPLILTAAAFTACWLPAVRASRSDPLRALREGD